MPAPAWRRSRAALALAAMVAASTAWIAATAHPVRAAAGSDEFVAYQADAAHDGVVAGATEAPPYVQAWSANLGEPVSYPVITQGRVFVVTGQTGSSPAQLYALDATTGQIAWGPVALGGTYDWAALTAGGGDVFAVNNSGVLTAFDITSGTQLWQAALPGQTSFTSPPTYANGYVYTGGAGSGGTLYAVRAADGSLAWTAPVANGDHSSPAVSANGVYVSYACEQTYDLDPATGVQLWLHTTGCQGGGGRTPVLASGQLLVRDSAGAAPTVLNASSGGSEGTFAATPAPADDNGVLIALSGGTLRATNLVTEAGLWSFSGDGQLTSAPVVANGYVYEASASGAVWALNESTGAVVWSGNAGAPVTAPDEQNVTQPLTGLGVGGGLLVVPASDTLVAYRHLDNDLTLNLPAPVSAVAPGPAGAAVTYNVSALDGSAPTAVSCSKASGSTFPLGATTVSCAATDADDTPISGSFTVTVNGLITLHLPPSLRVSASSRSGAVVTYSATATDPAGTPSISCSPASGSRFPVGTTTVTCSAHDADAPAVAGSFTVQVQRH